MSEPPKVEIFPGESLGDYLSRAFSALREWYVNAPIADVDAFRRKVEAEFPFRLVPKRPIPD